MMFADSIEVNKVDTVLCLKAGRLVATYRFSSEEDCRQAEMLVQQIELARNGN